MRAKSIRAVFENFNTALWNGVLSSVCVCVPVCVRACASERDRDIERDTERERKGDRTSSWRWLGLLSGHNAYVVILDHGTGVTSTG